MASARRRMADKVGHLQAKETPRPLMFSVESLSLHEAEPPSGSQHKVDDTSPPHQGRRDPRAHVVSRQVQDERTR